MTFNAGGAIFDASALGGSQSIAFANPVGNGGAGGLTLIGPGLLTLSASNSYSGPTTIDGGTLAVANDASLGNPYAAIVFDGGDLRITASGFTSARPINLTTANNSIDTNGFNVSLAGNLTDAAIEGGLTKLGTGTLTLTGSGSSFYGGLTVAAGVLSVTSSAGLGGGFNPVTVANGATLQVQNGIGDNQVGLTLNGSGVGGGGALENVSGNTTLRGFFFLGSSTRINSDGGTLTLYDRIPLAPRHHAQRRRRRQYRHPDGHQRLGRLDQRRRRRSPCKQPTPTPAPPPSPGRADPGQFGGPPEQHAEPQRRHAQLRAASLPPPWAAWKAPATSP